ncbi:hypothetical protein VTK73DRAFT_9144 [Phialemonium thermophilum]|uniref:Uncharacterized protein n=1 Tax=Phialemonium thermophilum TaxID=223376 RepID=A0ABR3XLI6_9PEZI
MFAAQQQRYWTRLGFGVAASLATLGLTTFIAPQTSANILGFTQLVEHASSDVPGVMGFIGARDLSISLAIFLLGCRGKAPEMGTIILSCVVFCVVDIIIAWENARYVEALGALPPVAFVGYVGLNLYKSTA